MDVIKQRRLLTATAAGLLVGTIGAVAWSLSALPESSTTQTNLRPRNLDQSIASPGGTDLAMDSKILGLTLRQSLEDPKPPPKPEPPPRVVRQPKPPAEPKLELTVLGTVIDPNRRLAIISDPSGNFDIKGVGESLELSPDGVSVQSIEPDAVTLVHNNKSSTFTIDKKRIRMKSQTNKKGGGRNR